MQARLAAFLGSILGLALLVKCGGGTKRPEAADAPPATSASAPEEEAGGAGGAAAEEPEEKPRRPDPKLVQKALDRTGQAAPDAAETHGLRFEVVEIGPDASWAVTVVNRGSEDAHVVFDPRLLTLEIEAPPDPQRPKHKKAPKPRVCRLPPPLRPETGEKDFVVVLPPGHGMVEAFDPRLYCLPEQGVSPLVSGAKVRATFGFPLKTKTVWKRGKRTEEVLPQVAPFVANVFPADAHRHRLEELEPDEHGSKHDKHGSEHDKHGSDHEKRGSDHEKHGQGGHGRGGHRPHEHGAAATQPDAGAPAVLDEPADSVTEAKNGEPTASIKILTATPFELGADYAPPTKLEEPKLSLELVRGSDAVSESGATVTLKLANHGKTAERVFFRREFVSFQVTGPDGALICDAQPDGRAPDRQAFSLLNPGGSLTVTSLLVELCPDDTFARPGIYVVEAAFDAFADGKEFGFDAFVGHLVAERGVVVRVQTGSLPFPGPRTLERLRVGASQGP